MLRRNLLLIATLAACAPDEVDSAEDGENDAFVGKADTGGLAEGSADALAVLAVANTASLYELENKIRVSSRVAHNIVAYRLGDDGRAGTADDERFDTLSELDAIPYVGPIVFGRFVTYVRTQTGNASVSGTWELESSFSFNRGVPPAVGGLVAMAVDLMDSPNDPATWILDSDANVKSALAQLRPALDIVMAAFLREAPGAAGFVDLANDIGRTARTLGLASRLEITAGANGSTVARHVIHGVFFRVGSRRVDRTLAQLGLDEIVVDRIPVQRASGGVTIGDHVIALSVGKVVRNGVLQVLAGGASSVYERFVDLVDCGALAVSVADDLGLSSATFIEAVCESALHAGAAILDGELGKAAATPGWLSLRGTARVLDTDGDGRADVLTGGAWQGTLNLGDIPVAVAGAEQAFSARRTR